MIRANNKKITTYNFVAFEKFNNSYLEKDI